MDLRSVAFGVGERVRGWGQLLLDEDGVWFERRGAMGLPFAHRLQQRAPWPWAIRLLAADPAAVATAFDDAGAIPGWATITGIWLGDAIQVLTQSPLATNPETSDRRLFAVPPCQEPQGGWPEAPMGGRLQFKLQDLAEVGAAIAWVQFHPAPGRAVLVVSAADVEAVESVLRPQLGAALCVVSSRWTLTQLSSVRDALTAHWQDWGITHIRQPIDERGQRSIMLSVIRVVPELLRWAVDLPEGLLTVKSALLPLPIRSEAAPLPSSKATE